MFSRKFLISTLLSVMTLQAGSALAEDTKADILLKDGQTLWEKRDDQNKLDELIQLIAKSEADISTGSAAVQAQVRFLYAKALNRKGSEYTSDKDAKMKLFEAAMDQANKSTTAVDSANARFYYAAALARWAEAKGIMASLGKKDELIKNLNDSRTKVTLDGSSGDAYEGNGPDRVLGKIYAKLPAFAGGNRAKSLELLNKAYAAAPQFASNTVYLAEVLGGGNAAEKQKACDILAALLAQNPKTLMPERAIESVEEFKTGADLQKQLCAK